MVDAMPPETDSQKDGRTAMTSTSETDLEQKHWSQGVFRCAKVTAGVLVLNLIFIGIAAGLSGRYSYNKAFSSTAVVHNGNCTLISRWAIALDLLVNILSTISLAASNYSMQTLVAPTRQEIDRAHAKHKWLDIGSASSRNLFWIPKYRLALWFVLMITATPFHLIYNSIMFKSIPSNYYNVILGPKDLDIAAIGALGTPNVKNCVGIFPGHPGDGIVANYHWADFVSDLERGNYKTLSNDECVAFTNQNNQAGVKFMMMLTSDVSVKGGGNNSILFPFDFAGGPYTNSYYIHMGQLNAFSAADLTYSSTRHLAFTFSKNGENSSIFDDFPTNNDNVNGVIFSNAFDFTMGYCTSYGSDSSDCAEAQKLSNWVQEEQPSRTRLDKYMQANVTSHISLITYDVECTLERNYPPPSYTVDGDCIAIETEQICELLYSPYISLVVSLALFAKVIVIIFAARLSRCRSAPLLTIGDAVSSFLENPDSTTERMCWASRKDFPSQAWKSHRSIALSSTAESGRQEHSRLWKHLQGRKRWMHAPSITDWLMAILTSIMIFAVGVLLLREGFLGEQRNLGGPSVSASTTVQTLLNNGFSFNDYTTVTFGDWGSYYSWSMLTYAVVANIPQLAITFTYYWYNHMLTSMLANAEYSSYGISRKSLRVSRPTKNSQQRSTHFLSLPYRYSVPLMVISTLLHWLLTQSFFYIYSTPWVDGRRIEYYYSSRLGFLWLPILLAMVVGAVLVLVIIGLSFRRFKSAMPVVGSCSAAISAACHIPKDENLDQAALGLLGWGETPGVPAGAMENVGNGIEEHTGHCSFTSLDTVPPSLEKLYT